jgi:hypothetical protein
LLKLISNEPLSSSILLDHGNGVILELGVLFNDIFDSQVAILRHL